MLQLIVAILVAISIGQFELVSIKTWAVFLLMLASFILGPLSIPLGILLFIIAFFQKNNLRKEKIKDSGSILIGTSVVIFVFSIILTVIFNPFCFEKNKNIYSKDFKECVSNPLLTK